MAKKDCEATELIENIPNPDKKEWMIYGANWCGFCRRAHNIIKSKKVDYEYVQVDKYGGPSIVRDKFRDLIGDYHTIPLVFHNGKFIGGCNELKKYYSEDNST